MKTEIEYTTKNETIKVKGKGWLFIPIINISNRPHDFIKYKLKLPKSLGGGKLIDFYPPEYMNEKNKPKKEKKNDKK